MIVAPQTLWGIEAALALALGLLALLSLFALGYALALCLLRPLRERGLLGERRRSPERGESDDSVFALGPTEISTPPPCPHTQPGNAP
jgi:hypothetical protein